MSWLLYGEEIYLIEQEIKAISKQKRLEPKVFEPEDSLENILLEISTIAMFYDAKLVLIKNHPALTIEKQAQQIYDRLVESKGTVELIVVFEDKRYPKTSLSAYLETSGIVKQFNKLDSKAVVPTIKDIVKARNGTITNAAALKLALKIPEELGIIINEIDKLLLQSSDITELMVETSIGEYVKNDYFALSNALATGQNYEIIHAYRERLRSGDEPGLIIAQVASLLGLCLQVASYRSQGITNQEIADKLKIHAYRVKKAFELIGHATIDKVKKLVIKLNDLERNIKSGHIDPNLGLDYFVLQTINNL